MGAEFVELVGCPASGKSSVARELEQRGYVWVSSDGIRGELYGDEEIQGKRFEVFEEAGRRIRSALRSGRPCVLDATNLSMRKRKGMLHQLEKLTQQKRCILCIASPEELKRRDQERGRHVTDTVIERMIMSFECPYYDEGFSQIEVYWSGDGYAFPFDEADRFEQDNPHHTLTLGEHLAHTEQYCREHRGSPAAVMAARYHDIGKLYTKSWTDYKGNPLDHAVYFQHENYSAYLFLCEKFSEDPYRADVREMLYIAKLINCHMRKLTQWREHPQSEQAFRERMGEEFYRDLMDLYEADCASHMPAVK